MTVNVQRGRGTDKVHSSDGSLTLSEQTRRHQDFLDAPPITVRCGLCPDWQFDGPSLEARAAASLHRAELHPDQAEKRRTVKRECKVPGCVKHCKPGSDRCWDHATVKEAATDVPENDLARERAQVGAASSTAAVLGEVALVGESAVTGSADVLGDPVRSDASPNTDIHDDERATMECKTDGCDRDASDAPKAGPTARLCATHRAERSAEISKARTGRPRGAQGVALGGGNASQPKKPRRAAVAKPKRARKIVIGVPPAAVNGSHTAKAERLLAAATAVDDAEAALEQARATLKQAVEELAA